jgi:hypothetical protein|tara:strand:- start:805 stop:1209 length:405 start_codon:yes stop_codon:yes gene_type:complete
MKKLVISFLLAFIAFGILGGLFANFIFLPQLALWQEAFPDAVKPAPDFISGFLLGIIQLVGTIYLIDRLKIDNIKDGAIFGAISTVALWLMIDLQMVSISNIFSYDYVLTDAALSAVMGAIIGALIAWSLKRFS